MSKIKKKKATIKKSAQKNKRNKHFLKKFLVAERVKKFAVKKRKSNKKTDKRAAKKKKMVFIKKSAKKINKQGKTPLFSKAAQFAPNSFFRAKIKVVGIGGGGGSIVSEIGRSLHKASFVVADTDVRSFKRRRGIKSFLFGQEMTHGLGTGLNTELARSAAEQEKEKIAKLLRGQDIVIFIVSLGGGLGSGAARVFAEAATNLGCITFGIFTLPFKFEGQNKHKAARGALKELRSIFNISITIPNEKIFKVIDSNTAITEAFSIVNRNLVSSLESLIDLIHSPGVINIDFADLRTALRGSGNLAFLNIVESSGKNRAEETIQKIMNNPLYENSGFTVEKVLFNIAGGGNLSMFEVDKISREIAAKNPKAKIIFGISKNSGYKNKIKTTLLMAGPAAGEEAKSTEITASAKVQFKKVAKSNIAKSGVAAKKKSKKIAGLADKRKESSKIKRKTQKQTKPSVPEQEKTNESEANKTFFGGVFSPVFSGAGVDEISVRKLSIAETTRSDKKTIRRTALEVKKEQEEEIQQKTQQEKEWEIPAFLRFKK